MLYFCSYGKSIRMYLLIIYNIGENISKTKINWKILLLLITLYKQ